VIEVDVGEHLENDVGATAAGDRRYPIEIAGLAVIDRVMRALRADHLNTAIRSCGANHRRPGRHRKLRCRNANAAARAVNQHRIAGARVGAAEQRPPCRDVGHEQPGALRKRNAIGQPVNLFGRANDVLRIGAVRLAGHSAADIHAIAGLPHCDALAGLIDRAGRVRAGRVR
jgi:hypothetical protein